jgi:hypothetical protein
LEDFSPILFGGFSSWQGVSYSLELASTADQIARKSYRRFFSTKTTFPSFRQTDAKLKNPLETRQQIFHAIAASCVQSH